MIDPSYLLALVLQGKSRPEIARALGVERKLVDAYMSKHPELSDESKTHPTLEQLDSFKDIKRRFSRKKQQSKGSKWEFTIKPEDVVWPDVCPVLGIALDYFTERLSDNSPTMDRVNSQLGYVQGNVKVVSWRANRIKNDGNAEEHRQVADYIDKFYMSSAMLS